MAFVQIDEYNQQRLTAHDTVGQLNCLVEKSQDRQPNKVRVDLMLPISFTDKDLKGKGRPEDWDFVPLEVPPTEPPTSDDTPSASASCIDNTHAETRRYPKRSYRPVKCFVMVEW